VTIKFQYPDRDTPIRDIRVRKEKKDELMIHYAGLSYRNMNSGQYKDIIISEEEYKYLKKFFLDTYYKYQKDSDLKIFELKN